jgi:hypothetical protein
MMIGDLNSDLLCSITNTRDKCLNKYDNYMVIGDLNYDLMFQITYHHVIVIFSQTFVTSNRQYS